MKKQLDRDQIKTLARVKRQLEALTVEDCHEIGYIFGIYPKFVTQLKTGSKPLSWTMAMLFFLYFENQALKRRIGDLVRGK